MQNFVNPEFLFRQLDQKNVKRILLEEVADATFQSLIGTFKNCIMRICI